MEKKSSPYIIEPITNRNFQNTFHYQNGTNQRYHTQKQKGYHNQSIQTHQYRNLSPPYLKYNNHSFRLNNK